MRFQPDTAEGVNLVSRHEPQRDGGPPARIWVGPVLWTASVLVPWSGAVQAWHEGGFGTLAAADFERIAALAPEVVIFGSGARLRFVAPALLRPLIERRIGVETMDTAAACRTYNVLASERRRVAAALLIEPASTPQPPKSGSAETL